MLLCINIRHGVIAVFHYVSELIAYSIIIIKFFKRMMSCIIVNLAKAFDMKFNEKNLAFALNSCNCCLTTLQKKGIAHNLNPIPHPQNQMLCLHLKIPRYLLFSLF